MGLIEELKEDHRKLSELLVSLKGPGLGAEEKLKRLLEARSMLIAHLQKEEQQLYPALIEGAGPGSYSMAGEFAKGMQSLSVEVNQYFDQCIKILESNNPTLDGFGTVLAKLTTRIRREETILYPEYDKTVSK